MGAVDTPFDHTNLLPLLMQVYVREFTRAVALMLEHLTPLLITGVAANAFNPINVSKPASEKDRKYRLLLMPIV